MPLKKNENLILAPSPIAPKGRWKVWTLAIRPKTLTLSLAPVLLGGALALKEGFFFPILFIKTLLCSFLLQIGSNLANDYFDFQKGVDTAERLGPPRVMQNRWVSEGGMRIALALTFALVLFLSLSLMIRGGKPIAIIGLLCIAFAILYSGGPRPLASLGLGELLVLIFFGVVPTFGTYYLQTLKVDFSVMILGLAPGCLASCVMCTNNLRDIQTDAQVQKRTLCVFFGKRWGQFEYLALTLIGFILPLFFLPKRTFFSLLLLPLFFPPLKTVFQYKDPRELNAVLAYTAKGTLLHSLVLGALYLL